METFGHQTGEASNLVPPGEGGFHGAKRRRRPSGQPPPLPRELGTAGRFWIGAILVLIILIGVVIVFNSVQGAFNRQEGRILRWMAERRTGWLNRTMLAVNGLGSTAFTRTLRLGTVATLLAVRRWRHLLVLVLTLLVVAWVRNKMAFYLIRPRPFGVRIIGGWEGFSSRPGP
jgi:hypothetical protein